MSGLFLTAAILAPPQRWNDAQLQQCAGGTCPQAGGPHGGSQQGNALTVAGKADGGTYTPGEQITLTCQNTQYALYASANGAALGRQNNAALTITAPQTGTLALVAAGATGSGAQVTYEVITLTAGGGGGDPGGGGGGGGTPVGGAPPPPPAPPLAVILTLTASGAAGRNVTSAALVSGAVRLPPWTSWWLRAGLRACWL